METDPDGQQPEKAETKREMKRMTVRKHKSETTKNTKKEEDREVIEETESQEKEAKNKELSATCQERESDIGSNRAERNISEGNVATATAAGLSSAATKAKLLAALEEKGQGRSPG